MRKIVLTFGLIAGAIMSAMMLLTIPFVIRKDFDKGEIIGYTTMVVAFLMIYFGIRAYRDNVAGGEIGFGRALVVGLLIMAVANACYVATWEVLYYNVYPDFGDKYSAHVLEKARAQGASEAELASKQQEMAEFKEMYKNPLVNIAFTFLEPLPPGLLLTLISAALLRRRRKEAGVPALA
jgi:hypothetical protein